MKNFITLLVTAAAIFTNGILFSQSATTQKANYIESETIVVNYAGFPGNAQDWIAVAQVSMADDKSMQWIYTEGRTSGTMNFNALPKGEYEVRGYFKNEYTVRTRYRFTVGNIVVNATAKAETEKPVYKAGEQIIIVYSGFPGNPQDWISVAQINMLDNQSNQWIYTEGAQSGKMTFSGLPEGNYEVRGYFKNLYDVHSRYQFTVTKEGSTNTNTNTNTVTGTPSTLCRRELSTFYAGIGGLGSAWARAAHEPTIIPAGAVADMQAVIANAKTALEVVKCVPYDVKNIDALIAKLPSLTNVQAVAEIEKTIKDIQAAISFVKLDCGNGSTLMSLYGLGIHMGAAQAHASSRMCLPAPMPADLQTVIFNHLLTAQNSFADFLPCVPGFPLSSITAIPLGSSNSVEPHISIIMLHANLLWNIALSDCCCSCK